MNRFKSISIKPILLPLCYLLLLSLIYSSVFLFGTIATDGIINFIFEIVMGLASSIGFYWICTKIWQEGKMDAAILLKVLSLELLYMFIALVILEPLSQMDSVVGQVIGLLFMVSLIPFQLLYFYALTKGRLTFKSILSFIFSVLKKHNRTIINKFIICFLIIVFMETMTGGMMSITGGFNTCSLAYMQLLYGNPLISAVMYSYFSVAFQVSFNEVFLYVLMHLFLGFCYGLIDVNYILFIKRKSNADEA